MKVDKVRCEWVTTEPLDISYHDEEWGVPVHDDRLLFEMLNLEGAQAGLSWITILKKRKNYKKAFDGFDPKKIVKYDEKKFKELMADAGIIRNRLKIQATIQNAKAYLSVVKEFGSFDTYIWQFTKGKTINNKISKNSDYQTKTPESIAMSKDLLKRGFRFVGPTTCYAFMQAVGMVNDHQTKCFRYKEIQ